jgi:DNA polymerase-3 subunit delta'
MDETTGAHVRPPARPLPWQHEVWQRHVAPVLAAGQGHHAWLLHGPSGLGKWELASAVAEARLCQSRSGEARDGQPAGVACGRCGACRLLAARSHPDLHWLVPQALRPRLGLPEEPAKDDRKPSQDIVVDDVRGLVDAFTRTTYLGGARVAIVYPADALNAVAANTLLKTLEEPPPATLFILVAHRPGRLLATVRSRCLPLRAPQPSAAEALDWLRSELPGSADAAQLAANLALCAQRALLARELIAAGVDLASWVAQVARRQWRTAGGFDPMKAATSAQLPALELAAGALLRWLDDVGRLRALRGGAARQSPSIDMPYFPALQEEAAQWAARMSWEGWRHAHAAVVQALRHADHPVIAPLFIEALLVKLQEGLDTRNLQGGAV